MPDASDTNPWRYFSLGLELAVAALVLALVGWWIDSRWGTAPWGVLVGAALGFVVGMYRFILQARQAIRESQTPRHPGQPATPSAPRTDSDRR